MHAAQMLADAAVVAVYRPELHAVHRVEPSGEYQPALHAVQMLADAPVVAVYRPALHAVHSVEPCREYQPAWHAVQFARALALEYAATALSAAAAVNA